ncbi:MAG: hypothetical protein Q9172_001545 [Xanthocarpia lactea]
MEPVPIIFGPQNDPQRWNFAPTDLDYILAALPIANLSAGDENIYAVRIAVCGLRHRYPDEFNTRLIIDIQHAMNYLEQHEHPYIAAWNAAGPHSPRQTDAKARFRADYEALREIWASQLARLEVVETEEDLNDYEGFPASALDYLCVGKRQNAMSNADLAKALERMYPQGSLGCAKKLKPFTEENVPRIFDYLLSAGWLLYDEWVLGDDPADKREGMLAELRAEARAA